MDWQQFLQVIAIPAWAFNLGAIVWAYIDLRASIRFNEQQVTAAIALVKAKQQELELATVKGYVPKDDVVRLEERLLAAIGRIEVKIDRIQEEK